MQIPDFAASAIILVIALPLISALLLKDKRGGYLFRYLRCLAVYLLVWTVVLVGYVFQSALSDFIERGHPYSNIHLGPIDWINWLFINEFERHNASIYTITSCITSFALLAGKDARSRAAYTLRCAFIGFVVFDIFIGIETAADVSMYVLYIVLDFVGAFLLSVSAPFLADRIIPVSLRPKRSTTQAANG